MSPLFIALIISGTILLFLLLSGFKVVRPTERAFIETFGKYSKCCSPGLHFIFPIIRRLYRVNTTEIMSDIEPQKIITKNRMNTQVDLVIYYKVRSDEDSIKKSLYNVYDFHSEIEMLAKTTARNVIGELIFEDVNSKRNELNKKTAAIDYVSAKEIEADGEKRAQIKVAEGRKQGAILEAQGQAQAFDMINKTFVGNAQILRQLDVAENSLKDNSKIILTDKGISPQLILGEIPIQRQVKAAK